MPLPGIENLLDVASLENLEVSPSQETIPAIAEDPSVQSSQRGMIWTQDDSIVATFPRELHIFSLAEVLANQNIIDFNMERILNKIRVTGILQLFVEHRYKI